MDEVKTDWQIAYEAALANGCCRGSAQLAADDVITEAAEQARTLDRDR